MVNSSAQGTDFLFQDCSHTLSTCISLLRTILLHCSYYCISIDTPLASSHELLIAAPVVCSAAPPLPARAQLQRLPAATVYFACGLLCHLNKVELYHSHAS